MIDWLMREKWKDRSERRKQRTKCLYTVVTYIENGRYSIDLIFCWRWWSAWQNKRNIYVYFFLGNKVHYGFSAGVLLRDIFYRHPKYHWNEIRESPISLRLRHNKIITLSKSSLHVICERKTPTQCALECTWRQWSSFVGCMSWGSVLGFNNVQIFWRTHIHIHFKADNMFHFHRIIKMRSNTIYECELDYARC